MERGRGKTGDRSMVYLLAMEVTSKYYHMDRKPPVTAGLIAANTLIYLRPGVLDDLLPSLSESLLREGVQLERVKGSTEFASAVVVLLGMSHGIEGLNSNSLNEESLRQRRFLGYVSGIIAGYLYLWLGRFFSCSNPFTPFLRKFTWVVGLPLRLVQGYLNR